MNNFSRILKQAYNQFILNIEGKKVNIPYRINIPFQPDRRKYGKSDPKTLLEDIENIAKEQVFNLKAASKEEIIQFMQTNLLGIDCSGFVYHMLNFLLNKIGKGGMEKISFPKASLTNVTLLTSDKFSNKIHELKDVKPGDLIRLNSDKDIPHILIVTEHQNGIITYAHSSTLTKVKGVHKDQIKNYQLLLGELQTFSYNIDSGDGVWRLKAL